MQTLRKIILAQLRKSRIEGCLSPFWVRAQVSPRWLPHIRSTQVVAEVNDVPAPWWLGYSSWAMGRRGEYIADIPRGIRKAKGVKATLRGSRGRPWTKCW